MFSQKNRLAKSKDINLVYSHGRSFFNPYFTIKYGKSPLAVPRFTVVVSTKVAKRATERNRIKRQIREVLKGLLHVAVIGDYVITVRSKAAVLTNEQVRQEFMQLVMRSKLFSGEKYV